MQPPIVAWYGDHQTCGLAEPVGPTACAGPWIHSSAPKSARLVQSIERREYDFRRGADAIVGVAELGQHLARRRENEDRRHRQAVVAAVRGLGWIEQIELT